MNQNKEDYLKIIYQEGGEQNVVPNKVIAAKLGVAPASVTEMLAKLSKQGLIHYEAYKGSRLTELGLKSCLSVVRSHRLWEVFLMRHLDYSWSEAHEDAHLLEHAAPARMVDKLDKFLNHPAYCPHGSVIPGSDGSVPAATLRPLSELMPEEKAVIRRITEEKALLDYLESLPLPIQEEIEVLAVGEYEGPLTLLAGGRKIQISHKAACQVFVE